MSLTAKQVQDLIRQGIPMAEEIDLQIEEVGEGYARIRIPFQDKNLRPGGSVSGPVLMAAGDTAMYAAILGTVGEVVMAVTSNLNINFLQRPKDVDLIAEGSILKLGKRMAFCEVSVRGADSEDIFAHVTGSYSLPPAQ